MDNVKFIEVETGFDATLETFAIVDNGDDSYTSMPKATYDAQQAARVAPQA